MGLKDWLLPREERFFDLLEAQSAKVVEGVDAFLHLVEKWENPVEGGRRVKDLEHEGDLLVHGVFEALNKTFITPIDREDIARLAKALDDVLDFTHHVSEHLILYEISRPTPELVDLAQTLAKQVRYLDEAVRHLREPARREELKKKLVEVHRLENHADDVTTRAIAALFKQDDVKYTIKMKEIYESLETATDKCEDAADVIRDVVVKHA